MPTLAERLLVEDRRQTLVSRCVCLVEQQVESQIVVRRLALKAGLAVLHAVQPNALHVVVDDLLSPFAQALDPLYQRFHDACGADFSQFLQQHPDAAAEALLLAADLRAQQRGNAAVRAAYARLRPAAHGQVRAAVPALARIVAEHLQPGTEPVTPDVAAVAG